MSKFSSKGFTAIPNFLIRSSDLDAESFRVLIFLLSLNPCFPSIETIAEATFLSRATVLRRIKKLERLGLILIEKSPGVSNEYKLSDSVVIFQKVINISQKPVSHRHYTSVSQTLVPVSHRHPININTTTNDSSVINDSFGTESTKNDWGGNDEKQAVNKLKLLLLNKD